MIVAQEVTDWTKTEERFLRRYYPRHDTFWIARQLKRSYYSVSGKARRMGLHKKGKRASWLGCKGPMHAFLAMKNKKR